MLKPLRPLALAITTVEVLTREESEQYRKNEADLRSRLRMLKDEVYKGQSGENLQIWVHNM